MGWARLAALRGDASSAMAAVAKWMPVIERDTAGNSPERWLADHNASGVLRRGGRPAEAERYARECLRISREQHFAKSDPRLAQSWELLGEAKAAENEPAQAIESLEQARAVYARAGTTEEAGVVRVDRRITEIRTGAH